MATPTSSRRTFSRFSTVPQPQVSGAVTSGTEDLASVSASVGHDHWANDVLKAVDKGLGNGSQSPGSNSPESYYGDSASDSGRVDSAQVGLGGGTASTSATSSKAEVIKLKVLEKKRKFHTGRCLELKNLPDGCVEQVRL